MYVHPNVIEKLQSKRIDIGKMTPDQVADVAYSALYNNNSKVLSTRFPHIQASTKFNSDGVTANTAYIGEYQGDGSVKSVYINDIGDINKQSLEGGGQPSSTRRLNGSVPSSTNLSDGQSVVNAPIIPSNQAKVNANQEQNSDTYWDSLTEQAENEGNIKIKGNATEAIPE
ncbi:MAG: hypothetical protein Q4G02_03430, partial [bacterium]|nr:hypothetical protein [bacterium]